MFKLKQKLTGFVSQKAQNSNTALGILLFIIIVNFFLPDPIPFVDELISIPVAIAIITRLLGNRAKKHKSKPPKDMLDTSKAEDGELVD